MTIFDQHIFLVVAAILVLGALFGRLTNLFKLPRITGYILVGVVLGPSILKIFSEKSLMQLEFLPEFALGTVAFLIGAGLSIELFKKLGLQMFLITLFESAGAFFLVLFTLLFFKMPLGAALPLAAIAPATAPAATLAIIKELRCSGSMTNTVLAIVALDDAFSIIIFGFVLSIDVRHLGSFGQVALESLLVSFYSILGALLLGLVIGFITYFVAKLFKDRTDTMIVVLGMIFLGLAMANIFGVSELLTNMFVGFVFVNMVAGKNEEIIQLTEKITPPLYCLFFVLAGAHLDLNVFHSVGYSLMIWAVVFILMRGIGQVGGAYLAALLGKMPDKIRKYVGLTLIPQAGVAIGLSLLITPASSYFDYRTIIINVTLMGVAVNEIVGPILTKYAFVHSGEACLDEK